MAPANQSKPSSFAIATATPPPDALRHATVGSAPSPAGSPAGEGRPATAADALTGQRLGQVVLGDLLGSGGMGRVYAGWHEIYQCAVAVKVVKDPLAEVDRFLREARLAVRLQHPNVVRLFQAEIQRDRLFLVLERVDGGNIKQLIQREGALPWRKALDLLVQAARGLAAVHAAGIVHRDVKPSNMLLTATGQVKLSDLGLAADGDADHSLTESGRVLGTPAYIAPEQAKDSSRASPRSDVYALGISLYHMLAGEVPFKRSGYTDVLLAHIQDTPPDIRRKVGDLPPAVATLLERMIAKDPARRPADAAAVVAEIERLLGVAAGERTALDRPAQPGRSWRALQVASIVSAVAIAGACWGLVAFAKHPSSANAAAATEPAAVPPAAVAAAAAAWKTPERAIFLLAKDLTPATSTAILDAMRASGQRVIERAELPALQQEQLLAQGNQIDAQTAVRIGHLIGGHVALIAVAAEGQVHLRSVVVETGEIAQAAIAAAADIVKSVPREIDAALALVGVQGQALRRDAKGAYELDIGQRHGLRKGDRLEVVAGTADHPGAVLTTAQVDDVQRDHALVTIADPQPTLPVLVRRTAP